MPSTLRSPPSILETRRPVDVERRFLRPTADLPADAPFDLWHRYLAAARLVEKLCRGVTEPIKILDVGCNAVDLLAQLCDPELVQVTRCDTLEGPADDPLYVQLDPAAPLPFAAGSFDAVVALEVLEHVPADGRYGFLADLVRVARRGIVVSCPNGSPEVEAAEQLVSAAYQLRHGEPHPFLREHAEFGLPTESQVRAMLAGFELPFAVVPGLSVEQWIAANVVSEGFLERFRGMNWQAELSEALLDRPIDAAALPYRNMYVVAKSFDATEALAIPASGGRQPPVNWPRPLGADAPRSPVTDLAAALNHCTIAAAGVVARQEEQTRLVPAALREVIKEQQRGLDAQELRFQVLTSYADALTQSAGWRMLAPLRWIKNLLRPRGFSERDLLPWQQLEPLNGEPGGWKTLGDDPQFLVSCYLPAGWVRVHLQATVSDRTRIEFHAEHQGTISSATLLGQFTLTAGRNDEEFFLYLKRPTRAMRVDPMNAKGEIRIERLTVTPRPGPYAVVDALRRKLRLLKAYHNTGPVLRRGVQLLATGQWREVAKKWALGLDDPRCTRHGFYEPDEAYAKWIADRALTDADRAATREWAGELIRPPVYSIVLPTYNTPERFLRLALDSVVKQTYPHWELCVADDGSQEPHVRRILEEYAAKDARIKLAPPGRHGGISAATNAAMAMATGDFVALFDHDDELAEHALATMAKAAIAEPDADMFYSDEDKIQADGLRRTPFFKPDWSPTFFLGCMYTCHLGVYRREIVQELGGFRAEFDGAQDYDLALRVIERARKIVHVPDILYHWRLLPNSTASGVAAKPEAQAAALNALEAHTRRIGRPARAGVGPSAGLNFVRFPVVGTPTVSIIIPSTCKDGMLEHCVRSIRERSTWKTFEIIVLDRQQMPADLERRLIRETTSRVAYAEPFNWSRVNNLGAARATGDYLLFLNDDMEIISPEWIEAMLEFAQQPEVGAVGAKLKFPDGSLQHVGVTVLDGKPGHPFYGYPGQHTGYFCRNVLPHDSAAVTGACLMTRADVFRRVGGFDESFPLNYNDVDYCFKVRAAGLRVVFTPHAELTHFEGATKAGVFAEELTAFQARWGDAATDPFYNPNLNTETFDYRIANQRERGR